MPDERPYRGRLLLLCFAFPAVLVALFARLSYVQFFHPREFGMRAAQQHDLLLALPPYRGRILDRSGAPLALDMELDSLGARSKHVKDAAPLAEALHGILGLDRGYLKERLRRPKEFVWLARKIRPDQSEAVRRLNHPELELRQEWKRVYPNGGAAAHVLGFTGLDHEGLDGLERHFDSYLKGVPGWKFTRRDAKRREVVAKAGEWVLPVDGTDIRLTIDTVIQHLAERELEATCRKYRALGGSVTVMDPVTGDILALANWPGFDPNAVGKAKGDALRNRAITDIYEPGSVFKVVTLAAVLEEKLMTLDDPVFCELGSWRTGGRVLHDVHGYGKLRLEEVIAKSSNIGTVKAAQKLGPERLHAYIKKFGFGERTGVDLAGESPGLLTHPKNWSATSASSVPIGQEVGVTALQLASAFSVFAHDGTLVRPRLVTAIRKPSGETVREFPPAPRRRVVSEETAALVRRTLKKVVREGTGKQAAVKGCQAGGKTGTSQKLEPDGTYSHAHFIASFAGFVEAGGRVVTISVMIDDPHPVYYGGVVAAPLFARVGEGIMDYWQAR